MTLAARIVQVNEYDLTDTAEAFVDAISALAERTEREGHTGVLGYQFFVDRIDGKAGAVIQYEDATAWLAHHRIAYEWHEMPALQATVSLTRLTLFGPFNDELREWLDGAGVSFVHLDELAPGAVR